MSDEAIWTRQPQVLETEMDQDISLYDPRDEKVTVLNVTAGDIWRLLDGETTLREIASLLARAYDADEEEVQGDVVRTVDELAAEDLVERVE